jgi:hypothetical protein
MSDESGGSGASSSGSGGGSLILRGADVEELLAWLEQTGGITLQQPERLLLSSSHTEAPEFSDGLLLASLVERLEGGGKKLVGVDWHPTAVVTRLKNIKCVLDVLKDKAGGGGGGKKIPLHLLHREFDLLEGRTDVLVPLIWHIRRVYEDEK